MQYASSSVPPPWSFNRNIFQRPQIIAPKQVVPSQYTMISPDTHQEIVSHYAHYQLSPKLGSVTYQQTPEMMHHVRPEMMHSHVRPVQAITLPEPFLRTQPINYSRPERQSLVISNMMHSEARRAQSADMHSLSQIAMDHKIESNIDQISQEMQQQREA